MSIFNSLRKIKDEFNTPAPKRRSSSFGFQSLIKALPINKKPIDSGVRSFKEADEILNEYRKPNMLQSILSFKRTIDVGPRAPRESDVYNREGVSPGSTSGRLRKKERTRTEKEWENVKIPETTARQNTSYDPLDPDQTKKGTTGVGAVEGLKVTEGMIAVPRKKGSKFTNKEGNIVEPVIPFGTIIYVPALNRQFLVADLKDEESDINDIRFDFALPGTLKEQNPKYNIPFEFQIIELGEEIWGKGGDHGHEDARKKAKEKDWTVNTYGL